MPLVELSVPNGPAAVPGDVRSFLREARRRIERFRRARRIPGFVPGDFGRVYPVLRALVEADLSRGSLFCEWGSGFGVVTCLAAMLDFDACGIEIDDELVDAARRLAADYGVPAEFACGSFIPAGGDTCWAAEDRFAWLTTDGASADEELGLAAHDFDVIFAYPWPDEERLTDVLFERYAAPGALLLTHHGGDEFRLRRRDESA